MHLQRANGLLVLGNITCICSDPRRPHLRGYLKEVFDAVSRYVPNVVPCGRARKYYHTATIDQLGKSNYLATLGGITSLLQACASLSSARRISLHRTEPCRGRHSLF